MKTPIDIDKTFDDLRSIKKVPLIDIPFDGIMGRVEAIQKEKASKTMLLSALVGVVLLICLNLSFSSSIKHTNSSKLLEELQLVSKNSIYSES